MKKHISKNAKSSIILCVVAYPIAYLIAAILWKITSIINVFDPIIPTIDSDVCIISLVLCINVISLLRFWGAEADSEDDIE